MTLTPYQRIFGAGPRGALISTLSFGLAAALENWLNLPPLHGSTPFGIAGLALGVVLTTAIVTWSLYALPPEARGRGLVTAGPFRYVRHPLYAAFLGPFDFGLALFLDGWIFLAWAALQYPLWHLNVAAEEKLMHGEFGSEYAVYCRRTGRFLPKLQIFARMFRD
jgi:protein-S-isoprenylcysteine O-methyltransferase Ste14